MPTRSGLSVPPRGQDRRRDLSKRRRRGGRSCPRYVPCYVFAMTKTQAQIIELFKTLDPAEQREIAEQLYERAVAGSFYDRITPQQRAWIDEGIAQAERGQVLPAEEVFDRLAKRFGFSEGEGR